MGHFLCALRDVAQSMIPETDPFIMRMLQNSAHLSEENIAMGNLTLSKPASSFKAAQELSEKLL